MCPDNGVAAIVRESALEVDSGRKKKRKKNLPLRGLEPTSVLRLAFQFDALSTELSPPRLPCLPQLNDEVVKKYFIHKILNSDASTLQCCEFRFVRFMRRKIAH